MLMAFAYLSLPGRIWRANGLNYILFPEDLPQAEGLCAPARNRPPAKPASQPRPFIKKEERPGGAPSKTAQSWTPPPIETWPDYWQKQFHLTRKGRFAWTYMHLGSDLSAGRAQDVSKNPEEAERRNLRGLCLRNLFADLGHPAGTHAFWPIAPPFPEGGEPAPNAECFWSGLDKLGCKGVIIMGSPAAYAAMGTRELKPLDKFFKFRKHIWILWEPDVIVSNQVVYNKTVAFLKRALGQFARP